METFELWSYDVSALGDLSEYAEHTYIRCPDRKSFFNCWGGHKSESQGAGIHRFSAQGRYDVADCYRRNIGTIKDTAGIGVYGVNGVCHQTANLFLCSTGRVITVDDGVKGYAVSVMAYGVHGDITPFAAPLQPIFYEAWKATVYNPCYQKVMTPEPVAGHLLLREIRDVRRSFLKLGAKMNNRELIHREAALVSSKVLPGLNTERFRDIHMDFLKEKADAIKKGMKGKKLADTINGMATGFQESLAQRIGAKAYERLTGLRKGQTVNLIDPNIAAGFAEKGEGTKEAVI